MMQQQKSSGKPPSESINYKDLPPEGQAQLAAKVGIKLNPEQIAQADAMDNVQVHDNTNSEIAHAEQYQKSTSKQLN